VAFKIPASAKPGVYSLRLTTRTGSGAIVQTTTLSVLP
jgi:hypothetical protein